MTEMIRPDYYGGPDDPYEVIKVIDAWGMGFSLGNAIKYIARAGKKDPAKRIEDLTKALFYIQHEIDSALTPQAKKTEAQCAVCEHRDGIECGWTGFEAVMSEFDICTAFEVVK